MGRGIQKSTAGDRQPSTTRLSAVEREATPGVWILWDSYLPRPQKGTWHGKGKEEEKVSAQVQGERRWKCFPEKARLIICQRVTPRLHLRSPRRLRIYFTVQVHSHPVPNLQMTGF